MGTLVYQHEGSSQRTESRLCLPEGDSAENVLQNVLTTLQLNFYFLASWMDPSNELFFGFRRMGTCQDAVGFFCGSFLFYNEHKIGREVWTVRGPTAAWM